MPYPLSQVNFTDQDDIVPPPGFGQDAIGNNDFVYSLAGNDRITGIGSSQQPSGLVNNPNSTINTGNGSDVITGYGWTDIYHHGIENSGSIETGDDGDYISSYGMFENTGIVSLGDGNDSLHIAINTNVAPYQVALSNSGTIEAGNGDDSLYIKGRFYNSSMVSLGYGNDSITVVNEDSYGFSTLQNYQIIETGDGDDIINSDGISNYSLINTGNGDDRITSRFNTIYNHSVINTGSGKDSLTGVFEGSYGHIYLGDGEDYLEGFSGSYYEGGNDQDTLALTSGSYTIGIGAGVSFTRIGDSKVLQTSGFEKLIVGNITYDFASLYAGQTVCA
jgi:hypothetical protein